MTAVARQKAPRAETLARLSETAQQENLQDRLFWTGPMKKDGLWPRWFTRHKKYNGPNSKIIQWDKHEVSCSGAVTKHGESLTCVWVRARRSTALLYTKIWCCCTMCLISGISKIWSQSKSGISSGLGSSEVSGNMKTHWNNTTSKSTAPNFCYFLIQILKVLNIKFISLNQWYSIKDNVVGRTVAWRRLQERRRLTLFWFVRPK